MKRLVWMVISGSALLGMICPLRSAIAAQPFPETLKDVISLDLRQRLRMPQAELDLKMRPEVLERRGWRVLVEAKGQSWVYYVSPSQRIRFDAFESITPVVKSALAKRLGIALNDLQIRATELLIGPQPNEQVRWRILTENSLLLFDLDQAGEPWQQVRQPRVSISGRLPAGYQSIVLKDVMKRQGNRLSELRLQAKQITWNNCQSASPDRPTPTEVGICADVNRKGWQVKVSGGALPLVYYVDAEANDGELVAPDGMQSIPQRAIALVKQDVVKRSQLAAEEIRIHRVDPRFFDRCLDLKGWNCRNGIQAGWVVMALGNQVTEGRSRVWFYHINLAGTQAKLTQFGTWVPPLARFQS
jgi:hypothetical protein